ncbi:hypothetical protein TNIN_394011 [Trichonephila inaurata madagascariensis]|uniref:Uncharacterized protein n=1 Tax=Trichonephila inaurata madagascariensis TaxID=2747483 RepID=A0A8X6Y4S5_9ARAC|nr:hypothetical protein TNIN_394011 [Trichonephila inaurata madagascariensis]
MGRKRQHWLRTSVLIFPRKIPRSPNLVNTEAIGLSAHRRPRLTDVGSDPTAVIHQRTGANQCGIKKLLSNHSPEILSIGKTDSGELNMSINMLKMPTYTILRFNKHT